MNSFPGWLKAVLVVAILALLAGGVFLYRVQKRRVRQPPALGSMHIVVVTSCAMTGDRERILAASCIGYIEKLINPETFVTEIEQHLKARPTGRRRSA